MATNYFEMMRDTVGAYGEGVDVGRRRRREDEQAAREQARFEQQQRDWEAANAQRQELNAAIGGLRAAHEGQLQSQGTGLSDPSARMLHAQGYGDASGQQAVRDAAGDFAREERRMGLRPTMDPTAEIRTRPSTEAEISQAAQRVALAQRDMGAWSRLEGDRRQSMLKDARRQEFQRINKLPDNELADLFSDSVNANPNVPAMVDFDPKSRKYVIVSKIPGIPTQSLSRAEMVQAVMGAWEAGNGDYTAGVQAMIQAAQGARQLENSNFERSRGLASDNANLFVQNRRLDNDDARTRMARESLGIQRDRAQMERAGQVQYMQDREGNFHAVYPVAGRGGVEFRQTPLPAGLRPPPKAGADRGPREVPAADTIMQEPDGRVWKAGGRGERLHVDAPPIAKRGAILEQAGFGKAAIEQLEWTPDGRYIAWGGMAYDVNDPRDMAQLRGEVQQYEADSIMAREVQSRGGFAPRYTDRYGADPLAAERRLDQSRQRGYGITTR